VVNERAQQKRRQWKGVAGDSRQDRNVGCIGLGKGRLSRSKSPKVEIGQGRGKGSLEVKHLFSARIAVPTFQGARYPCDRYWKSFYCMNYAKLLWLAR
jgi:hypothetical protein